MEAAAQAQPRVARLAALEEKYSYSGRLQRFCRGRISLLPLRLFYETAGGLLIAIFLSLGDGALALLCALAGEAAEMVIILLVLSGDRIEHNAKRAGRMVTVGSALWALGLSGGVFVIWSGGGKDLWILSLTFLAAAAINAHLVGGLHPSSLRVKNTIFSLVLIGLFVFEYKTMPAHKDEILVYFSSSILIAVTLTALFFRLHLQNRKRHNAERHLIEANLEQEATNEKLQRSQTELRARAEEAQELARRAEAASVAKSEFLATMSHEIRTPMNGIISMAELLRETPLKAAQTEMLETIDRSGTALMAIINDVLDFSRIEAGHLKISPAEFCPTQLVSDIAGLIRPLAEEKGLRFETDISLPSGMCLIGDEGRLRQILVNLIGNAVKFTDEGAVSLSVSGRDAEGDTVLSFCVADSGVGMEAVDLVRVFDAFEQVDAKITRSHGGAGLGLAISRRLARAMGGDVTATSTPGQGSEFTLRLTLSRSDERTAASDVPGRVRENADVLDAITILAAEDNRTNQFILRKVLEKTSATLHLAEDGIEVLERYRALRPDLVLMDMSMPRRSGLDAARDIRAAEADAGWPRCPILALTANAFIEDRAACEAAGMDGFLTKPIRQDALIDAVTACLDEAGAPPPESAPDAVAAPECELADDTLATPDTETAKATP